jgi:hypothetical protein
MEFAKVHLRSGIEVRYFQLARELGSEFCGRQDRGDLPSEPIAVNSRYNKSSKKFFWVNGEILGERSPRRRDF